MNTATRQEHDLIGYRDVPADAYYGIQTLRAFENFTVSGVRLHQFSTFVRALATVKKAAAIANNKVDVLDERIKDAIVAACDDVIDNKYHDQFIVDMFQGGAGTSTNMNANEVIANRALEILGYQKGDYQHVHPNNNVNLSQSTNDVYPTAMKVALDDYCTRLLQKMKVLHDSFINKSIELADELKMGRTHLQDAVPMTAGQEFNAFATMIKKEMARIESSRVLFHEINMGGTAIGTGLNAPVGYSELCAQTLEELTGRPYYIAEDLIEATQDTSPYVALSGNLRLLAARLSKIANDLRLQTSGPRAGLAQYRLPEMQPGSSIMPGKVNPVIPEVVNQACFHVMGVDNAIAMASESGQLQLNVFEPVMAFNLFTGMSMLSNVCEVFATRCIDGLMMNNEACRVEVFNNIGLVTALNPHLGYESSSYVAKKAQETGGSVYDIVLGEKLMNKETLDFVLSPANMVYPKVKLMP
ncbi:MULTISPECIES: aspartate ammonia-lyase [Psychrobacter]|uniref:Aspartate ammonia-lyase n=1 Tax=Psychrobacter fozii TaxID=198480 RepID=A0A2V4URX1_9GAMM|nr:MULTISPECIES: aspartate ammonia-lyase [Psychrobacter]MBH0065296.1 aspartate ammonia-lyase [Psychrobacter sp. SZ93C1]PYE36512.1 aspartate ammonia-lyase [Psychrobacter fozii]